MKAGFEMRAGSTLQRIDAVRDTHLKNFTIRVSRACSEIMRIKWAENCTVEQVTFRVSAVPDDSFMVLKIYLARNCKAVGCRSEYSSALIADLQKRMTKNYDCYSTYNNFRIISSQECVLENCTDNFASHAFNITYSSGGIPSIRCKIRNCRAVNSVWAGVIAQQCTPWSELAGNTVERSGQGVLAGCRGSKIMNNTVSTHLPFSTDYYYTRIARGGTVGVAVFEGYARDCEIRGNRVENFYTGIAVLDGYEELNVFDRVDAVIADNTVRNCIHGFYHYRNSYNTARGAMHVTLSGNVLNGAGDSVSAGGKQWETYGIRLSDCCGEYAIRSNATDGFRYGAALGRMPDYMTLDANRFSNGRYGIFLDDLSGTGETGDIHLHDSDNIFSSILIPRQGLDQACVKNY